MTETPEHAALRLTIQRSVDRLERMVAAAEAEQQTPDARKAYVRYGRQHLAEIESVVAQVSKTPLAGIDEARIRLDVVGDGLGMDRNDSKPRLKDRPEFNMGRSTLSGRQR